ncbi:uncharacterized protein LOC107001114 [Solanum pennellii]|uniref:Uncharacterized protein LOC107001114 n=1 Tax=Solanum pennellii TaxID=28526 RepID=A0ABM1FC91_SOLPN|nr:uncharacterized protein LOC107001114 [Solanum pennellii]
MQAQDMTAQVNRQDVQSENPPVHSMADRLRDFTRMNPPIFTGTKTSDDPQQIVDNVHKILVAIGATNIEKAELASYQLKDVEDSRIKRGFRDVRSARPHDQEGPSHGGNINNFSVREKPRFKKGKKSFGNSNPQGGATPRGARHEPKKGNGGEMLRPKKYFSKCGRAHNGECRQCTNSCFGCGTRRHIVRDCPQNRGNAGGNAQPRPNPQGAAAAKLPKRNRFYSLKGSTLSFVTPMIDHTLEVLPEVLHDPIVVSTPLKCVEVEPWKTEAVKNWPKPLTPTDIRSFFRLAGYNRRFVEGFSSIAAPFTTLTKKKA